MNEKEKQFVEETTELAKVALLIGLAPLFVKVLKEVFVGMGEWL